MTNLNIKDIINSNFAISTEKAELVFKLINNNLQKNNKVIIDFKGIDNYFIVLLKVIV